MIYNYCITLKYNFSNIKDKIYIYQEKIIN